MIDTNMRLYVLFLRNIESMPDKYERDRQTNIQTKTV